jgi:thiosulfate/3-mercaptopyruvate sulfurtransferase
MANFKSIVSAQWLQENLTNPDVVIIDCRFRLVEPNWGYEQYLKGHIPGAYYVNLDQDLSGSIQEHGGRHPLPNPKSLGSKLEQTGIIKGKTMVVAYDDCCFAFAARFWWLLRYYGHDQVALLDGGWNEWLNMGFSTSDSIPEQKTGSFQPQINLDWIIDINTLKQRKDLPSVVLVDSREGDRYRGEREPLDPIAGHIPGAVNLFWQQITDAQGKIQSLSIQQQLWQPYLDKEEIIVYCGSGVTACVNILSLEMLGIKDYKLYPGGWSDWCSYEKKTFYLTKNGSSLNS